MTREQLSKMVMKFMELEGNGVFQEHDGTISFNGINQKTYDSFRKKHNKPSQDVREINVEETLDLVNEEFVNRHGIENVPEEVMFPVLDTALNSGPSVAAKLFQRTVGAEQDGIIGPKTMNKFEEFKKENDFSGSYLDRRTEFLLDSEEPSVVNNRTGLINRVEEIRSMVGEDSDMTGSGVTAIKERLSE